MVSRKHRSHPALWLASALVVFLTGHGRASPIQVTISGTIGDSKIFGDTITPQTITLPEGLSSASGLGPIILAKADISSQESKLGLPANQLSAGYDYTQTEPLNIRLTFHPAGSSTTSAQAATIDLTGSSTMAFSVANGHEQFSVSVPSTLYGSITTAPGAGSSIPLSLLTQFTSVPFQLTGSMSQAACGNKFELALDFSGSPGGTSTPEPGTVWVVGVGSLLAWVARSRRIR